jgi:putative FmdB family regulatory protein
MPIYEYRCEECGQEFEEYLRTSTSPAPTCPGCSGAEVRREYSQFATKWKPSLVNWHRMPSKWGNPPPKKFF